MPPAPRCLYCDAPLRTYRYWRGGAPMPPDTWTTDHVFPRRLLRHEQHTVEWLLLNQQDCCAACNGTKGHQHPLNWLVTMPSAEGAARLAALLVELGVPKRRVEKWLAKRSAASTAHTPSQ